MEAAESPDFSTCDNPHYFKCELLMFHEDPNKLYPAGRDVVMMTWDFNNYYVKPGDPKNIALAGDPNDVVGISFGNYDEKCLSPAETVRYAENEYGADVSELISVEETNAADNSTFWQIRDQIPSPPNNPVPRHPVPTDHGYVGVLLEHRGDVEKHECIPYEEIRAVGKYAHNQEGSGALKGITVGFEVGPMSLSYTPDADPGKVEQRSSEIVALHPGGMGGAPPTKLAYTGPTSAHYQATFTASAKLTVSPKPGAEPSDPLAGQSVGFTLGGGGDGQTCTGTTDSSGQATCPLTITQRPGRTTMIVRYLGEGYQPASIVVPFTIERQKTAVSYVGIKKVANGAPARLSGQLAEREVGGTPVSGRALELSLGSGDDRQFCTGTTDSSGIASCTIPSVRQPLNADATIPAMVAFHGDDYYLASDASTEVLLEYYTGRAYGAGGGLGLPLLAVDLAPTPDTGPVRTAGASSTSTPCLGQVTGPLITASTLCPEVTTSLGPGTSHSTSTIDEAVIGLRGMPVIEIQGATATSMSTCGSGGSASGSTQMTLRIGGKAVAVPTQPNSAIDIAGGARLVVNEQIPVDGADHGLTVNALHLSAAGDLVDVVVASARSGVHHCANQ